MELDDETPSTKSGDDASDHEDLLSDTDSVLKPVNGPSKTQQIIQTISTISSSSSAEDDEIGDGLRTTTTTTPAVVAAAKGSDVGSTGVTNTTTTAQEQGGQLQLTLCNTTSSQLARTSSLPWIPGQVERRRRKLPEIPKNKKCELNALASGVNRVVRMSVQDFDKFRHFLFVSVDFEFIFNPNERTNNKFL